MTRLSRAPSVKIAKIAIAELNRRDNIVLVNYLVPRRIVFIVGGIVLQLHDYRTSRSAGTTNF